MNELVYKIIESLVLSICWAFWLNFLWPEKFYLKKKK